MRIGDCGVRSGVGADRIWRGEVFGREHDRRLCVCHIWYWLIRLREGALRRTGGDALVGKFFGYYELLWVTIGYYGLPEAAVSIRERRKVVEGCGVES